MGQHLYECACCHRHGIAHYRLVPDGLDYKGQPQYTNVRLCTGCYAAGCTGRCACCRKGAA